MIIDPPLRSALVQIKVLYLLLFFSFQFVLYGLAVMISGFNSGGPGSTPGLGISMFDFASSDIIGCLF